MQLEIQQLSKTYPNGVKALNQFSLTIGQGMFGLLGPNGAGKSTLMRTLATLQRPDEGQIRFNGINLLDEPMALRKVLGYLPQEFGVYPKLSALELLDYLARLKGIAKRTERKSLIERCLEITNLESVAHQSVSGYSGGMKQRFGIAQVLLNNPQLIIVDEPTAGLDPAERQRFLNILREISTTAVVIFSTHIVEDIKDLCTDMAIIQHGQVVQHNTPEEAISQLEGQVWTKSIPREALSGYEQRYRVLSSAFNRDNSLRIRVYAAAQPEDRFTPAVVGLEDVYFTTLVQPSTSLA